MTEIADRTVETAGGLAVWGAETTPGAAEARARLLADRVPQRLAAGDPELWGPAARAEAAIRLGWLAAPERSRPLVAPLAELAEELSDLDRVVLIGMGGSSLAPEVVAGTLGRPLVVLDTTDPHEVRAALADRPERTVLVVSSKSGTTVETDCVWRVYRHALGQAGLPAAEVTRRQVVVTDPGSPLAEAAAHDEVMTFLADPSVGGRYSALTAFGLVPSALLGVDVEELLAEAAALTPSLTAETGNPALALGCALAAGAVPTAGGPRRDTVAVAADGTGLVGMGDWIEQLLAESTGKQGRGLLPVVLETPDAPAGRDALRVTVGGSLAPGATPGGGVLPDLSVHGPLGAQFLAWEYATAVAGRLLAVNPFDQPNVAEAKEDTATILRQRPEPEPPAAVDGAVALHGTNATTVRDAVARLLDGLADDGYLAVTAFLDRRAEAAAPRLRRLLAGVTDRPVTFGWGPRYLHSTGQYHKGGPQRGAFLQITGEVIDDLPVPGRAYTLGELQAAQAAGDRAALRRRGRPVLWLHLRDRADGLAQLLQTVEELTR